MKRVALFYFTMAFQYCLLVINFRTVAHGSYIGTATTDLILAFNGFYLTKWIGESKGKKELAGYVLGGVSGSMIALWLSIHILHQ
jgi:hypothetical protein